MSYTDRDSDYDPYLDAQEDRAAFELERSEAWDNKVEDNEADRFEYYAAFSAEAQRDFAAADAREAAELVDTAAWHEAQEAARRVTVNPSFVFVERPDGSFDVHERRTLCVNRLLPFAQKEVA
jgi:hypothetical protein